MSEIPAEQKDEKPKTISDLEQEAIRNVLSLIAAAESGEDAHQGACAYGEMTRALHTSGR